MKLLPNWFLNPQYVQAATWKLLASLLLTHVRVFEVKTKKRGVVLGDNSVPLL